MAELNKVSKQIILGKFCDSQTLKDIPIRKKALIISDCEGYEKELFSEYTTSFLSSHDLIIEVHDFLDIEISSTIKKRFNETHNISTIRSIDDISKVHDYDYHELKHFTLNQKKDFLSEYRPHIMEWLFMTPKYKVMNK